MAVQMNLTMAMTAIETLAANVDGVNASQRDITHSAFNVSPGTKNATSTPSVSDVSSDTVALVAGAKTIDFTNLPLVGGGTLNASTGSLKPVAVLISNPAANTGAITVAKGATNGYTGFGASFSHVIQPGGSVCSYTAKHANVTAVSGTNKTLDFSGTGTESFNLIIIFG